VTSRVGPDLDGDPVTATNAQVRKFMDELAKEVPLGVAAARAGLDPKTARKYRDEQKFPLEMRKKRGYRTREDPFDADWPVIASKLEDAPELEAKTIFEELLGQHPDRYHLGQLRTLQRKVRDWHALQGPPKVVFFAQNHPPGDAMQTDFTWCTELLVTINGEAFVHMLCHVVLPYSNWEWVTVCRSESMAAIRRGVQSAVFMLGRVPKWNQTDNSTAATHNLAADDAGVKRPFNREYLGLMRHLGMEPRTIEVGESNQNGDVEALNGALKRRLLQHLLVRGHRDFESVSAYEEWAQAVATKANRLRAAKVGEELAVMRPLSVERLAEYSEEDILVTGWSTIRVKHNAYSVPSRLIGQWVRVRLFDDRLEVAFRGEDQLVVERLPGRNGHSINYRHIIWSLVQKPGAFALYRYREDLFPSLIFRRAYDSLLAKLELRKADIEYLRILHLAASTMEADVEVALGRLLDRGGVKSAEQVKALGTPVQLEVPSLAVPEIDLSVYDALLTAGVGT
jgi:hypothetical protein